VLLCALALTALVGVVNLVTNPWGAAGDRLGEAARRSGDALAVAGQRVRDAFDPTHPPRDYLDHDTEFDALQVVGAGALLGATSESRLELVGVSKRADATAAATAQYAVVRRTLATPVPRAVLGVPLGDERGEREHFLYKGQSLRLGSHYYKVNWVSFDRQQVALGRYRSADGVVGATVLAYD
jgi:hypothetical protein